jgi:hypothetical protein
MPESRGSDRTMAYFHKPAATSVLPASITNRQAMLRPERRRLTRRCSGLATLAAELQVVRQHKSMHRFAILLLGVAGLAAQSGWATTKRIPPPDVASLSTAWAGWDEDGYVFFRLVLRPDGTGLLAYTQVSQIVRCRIRHWSLTGTTLTGELVPIDDTGEAMSIQGRARHHKLTLVFTAKSFSNTRRVSFTAYRESEAQESTRVLTQAMSQP